MQFLPLQQINIESSRFCFFLQSDSDKEVILKRTIDEQGVLTPLVVWDDGQDNYDLVVGFRRASYASCKKISKVPCVILPHTSIDRAIDILLDRYFDEVSVTVVSKIRFIVFLLDLGLPRSCVKEKYLPVFQFKQHESILERCECIAKLPKEVLEFCHEKRFSMRQCYSLAHYPREILESLFSLRTQLALTASIVEELVENLGDTLKLNDQKPRDFFKLPEISEIFSAEISPQQRTQKLRGLIRQRRFPVLTSVNQEIEELYQKMDLPKNVVLEWDRSLENDGVSLKIGISDQKEWIETFVKLKNPPVGLEEMLKRI